MTKYVVDIHALIWFIEGNSKLGINAKTILEDTENKLILSVIVLAGAMQSFAYLTPDTLF
ncbi:hypothetical protein [Geminocystis sp. GBBB08]|uniref:hypothetical protein n=1 Tax=Geminocystis sp. GBBB08 TaxID=2604140 RepID=UPI0027E310E0|nr:hypothetical protein [Geminocystis sp. GBBB08]